MMIVLPLSTTPSARKLRQAARHAAKIDPAMVKEAPVLDGHDGFDEVIRKICPHSRVPRNSPRCPISVPSAASTITAGAALERSEARTRVMA